MRKQKERQALSIPAQKERVISQFGHLDIEFILDEKSAFKPYNRPGFAEMMQRIENGEKTGIIAWHPDRLSRNEIDASALTYGIRTNKVQSLLFATYNFENTPEGIWMLQMALSQSQYESAKKGKDVKRGEEKKCRMGWRPGVAPFGYLNFTDIDGIRKIKVDENYRTAIKKMFAMMLSGNYTPPQILRIFTEEHGLRSRKGKKLSKSSIYYLFTREFYYGSFEYPVKSNNWYLGKHDPFITKAQFEYIQKLLGKEGRPRAQKHKHAFTGSIKCGECGCFVVQEFKKKTQKNGNIHYYYFAHCSRRKNDYKCKQPSVHVSDLELQITERLKEIALPSGFHKFAMKHIKEINKKEGAVNQTLIQSKNLLITKARHKRNNLIDMRSGGELSAEDFKTQLLKVDSELFSMESNLTQVKQKDDAWVNLAENMFLFLEKAVIKFEKGTIEEKKAIFSALGSNFILKDKLLSIDLHSALLPIVSLSSEVYNKNTPFEPLESVVNKGVFDGLGSISTSVLPD